MVKEAVSPKESFSKEHWQNSIGLVGSIFGIGKLIPSPVKKSGNAAVEVKDVTESTSKTDSGKTGEGILNGTSKIPSDFGDRAKLEGHFDKHGKEFEGLYKNANEYLEGAKEVINNGIKVKYEYKD